MAEGVTGPRQDRMAAGDPKTSVHPTTGPGVVREGENAFEQETSPVHRCLALFAFVALGAAPALAAPEIRADTCAAHGEVVRALSIRFGELRRDGRLNGVDYDIELWSSIFGGWTTLMIRPDGLTCVTTDGDLWPDAAPEARANPA